MVDALVVIFRDSIHSGTVPADWRYKVRAVERKEEINTQEDCKEDDEIFGLENYFFVGMVESSIKNDLQAS
ncbi:hypothetical protein scyTo_0007393 [Scyliorhinus torazame]|uniref:Uncharacterized protein n=1 Tax=Scyliorhinus torazame TaxID=75743 RepID=A0A401NRJ1_SCYTO|nr:hypothetical protein [Scyliorhinus torazame]